jgi:putative colanic acid biosynthesis glycosyltransferase
MISMSIITVVLNDLDGLKRTHKSIIEQSHKNLEWIVCDGGSDARTTNFLKSVGDIVNWISKPDRGIYDAMNYGFSMSEGAEYIVFMNAGDTFFDSESLAKVSRYLMLESRVVDVLFGGAILSFSKSGRGIYRAPRLVENSLWHGLPANHQATYYRRSLLKKTPYNLQYSLCGDYYLAAILIRNGAYAAYLDEPLAIFEVGGQSYKNLGQLFAEPYRIQRDVLGSPWHYRLVSVLKRFLSTLGFVLLSQSFFRSK